MPVILITAIRKIVLGAGGKLLGGLKNIFFQSMLSAAGVFVLKLLLALGVGFYTFSSLNGFFDNLMAQYAAAYNSTPQIILAFLDIGGFSTGINTLLSGITFLVTYHASKIVISFVG
ncbi:DUF2523 family protein [Kingella kingae]|uniref:DUF2523 family protein n=3 Tax=Pseudomonadota TaxID=1224 RepID=UPI0009B7F208|nr:MULTISPECIES: DUF2523 family protein [Pseudomonadota]MCG9766807.1 DUF2523 domain-containing protein [Vibrio alginolyticus]MDK4525285.1 DUF2523 family protein [Kingella kingae]MDK4531079.1 DUF2523 family protein [Kingella kingae]MDK4533042.1 DUF2523 family protein [Kingella kingae]MDK4535172.1 DUF2523 family protein [Kingella kingae]